MRASILVNRQARFLREGGALLAALRRGAEPCTARGLGAEVIETRSLFELHAAAERAARADVVVLAGGDGSYSAGLTALAALGPLPLIALAPGGTVSTVARNLGFSGDPVRYVERLFAAIAADAPAVVAQPTLLVTDDAGGRRIGFIAGAGLVARFFDEYYAHPRKGYAGAAAIVARIFGASLVGGALAERILERVPMELTLDGAPAGAGAYSLAFASTVKSVGLHMHVAYRAGEDPSRIHVVASPLGPRKLGPQLPRVILGKRLRGEGHVDALVREAKFAFTRGADTYVLDGEPIRAGSFTLSPGPSLRLVTPLSRGR